jgi:ubiquitin C-terminal hydrolase
MVAIIDNLHKATKINEKQTSIPFLTEICNTSEFPAFLFSHITKGMKAIMSNRSLFYDLFLNVCYIEYKCPKCSGKQVKMEINSGMPLEILGKCNALSDLINTYFGVSIFEDYTCKICNSKVNISVKRNPIIFAPVLVFHIKRIIINPHTGGLAKTNKDIYYPIEGLDIKQYFSELIAAKYYNKDSTTQYNLTSVGMHMGSVKYGHYLAYLYNPISKKWESHNDSLINNVNETDILSNEAIVLTYTRKDLYSSAGSQIYSVGQAYQRIIDANPT